MRTSLPRIRQTAEMAALKPLDRPKTTRLTPSETIKP